MCPLRSRLPSMQTQDWGKGAENITHVRSAIFSNESDETLNRAIHQLQRHSCDIPPLVKTDRTNHGNGFFARGSKQAVQSSNRKKIIRGETRCKCPVEEYLRQRRTCPCEMDSKVGCGRCKDHIVVLSTCSPRSRGPLTDLGNYEQLLVASSQPLGISDVWHMFESIAPKPDIL